MNYSNIFKTISILLFLVFLIIFISGSTGYYEYSNNRKSSFTEEKIKEFEKDVAEGKNVKINDYITDDSKDYSNKVTILGDKVADIVNDSINFVLKESYNFIEKMVK